MKIEVKVRRFDPEKEKEPHYETYLVEYIEGMRVLHSLEQIRSKIDGTLSFRWNCGAGRCGSCAAEVDGKPVLTCKYEIPKGTKSITVTPMVVFPLVKDLVVDLTPMRTGLAKLTGFSSNEKPFWKIQQCDVSISREMRKCIECGICQDVCHIIRDRKLNYIGPRFAVKAASLNMHPKDNKDRSEEMHKQGLNLCNVTKCCQVNCPEKIRITDDAIIPLKEKHTDNLFKKKEKK